MQEFKGIGAVGSEIFLREVQVAWPGSRAAERALGGESPHSLEGSLVPSHMPTATEDRRPPSITGASRRPRRRVVAAFVGAAAVCATVAGTAAAVDGDTVATVGAPTQLVAGDRAPFDAPGVRSIRRGDPIPSGYVIVGRAVSVTPGRGKAGAVVRLTCPRGKTLSTVAGDLSFVLDDDYPGRRATNVASYGGRSGDPSGTAYAVCR